MTLGLPKGVVDRQLLDALLLPAPPPTEEPTHRPAGLNPSQLGAATHASGPFLLQAGPGTGKTSTLVSRVLNLAERSIDPAKILVLTFSKRAASEVAGRIAKALPDIGSRVWVGTFHQFGMDVVSRHYDQLGLPPRPSLLDTPAAVELLEDMLPTLELVHYRQLWKPALDLKDMLRAISRAKDELVGPERYAELAARMRSGAIRSGDEDAIKAAEKAAEVAKVYDCYQARMRAIGGVDYGDQVMLPAQLCARQPDVVAALRSRHSHILVDEYQDVNTASVCLLKALAGTGGEVWAVGDPRQAIYRFRGASATSMLRFHEDFGPFKASQLDVNYRSSEEVVKTFLEFGSGMKAARGMPTMRLSAERGSTGVVPSLAVLDTDEEELDAVIGSVEALATARVKHSEQVVLCRTNAKVDAVAAALEAAGIPVLHLGNIFERSEVRDLLCLLSFASDTTGTGLPRVAAFERYGMNLSDIRAVAGALRPDRGKVVAEAIAEMAPPSGLSEAGERGFLQLRLDLRSLGLWSSPWHFLTSYMLDRTDWMRTLALDDSVAGKMRRLAVWRFMEFIRVQSPATSGPPSRRLLDRIRRIVTIDEARSHGDLPEAAAHLNAVRVMTVHGSKGLEFEAVHLLGLNEGEIPKGFKPDRCPPPPGLVTIPETGDGATMEEDAFAEEECLFFVATSRARTYLMMYRSRGAKAVNGDGRNASSFLDRCGPFACRGTPKTFRRPSSLKPRTVDVVWPDGVPLVEGHHLALYAKCPRRLLHTHILGIRGARKTGPFAQTHDCVEKLIDTLKSGDGRPVARTLEDLERDFETIWRAMGPHDHAFAEFYRTLGSSLIRNLYVSLGVRGSLQRSVSEVRLGAGRVQARADDQTADDDGTVVFRRVRTGTDPGQKAAEDDLSYLLLNIAASFLPGGGRVEADYLTDGRTRPVSLTKVKLRNRVGKAVELMEALARGDFPAIPNSRSCPQCPHWFACGSLASGEVVMVRPGAAHEISN